MTFYEHQQTYIQRRYRELREIQQALSCQSTVEAQLIMHKIRGGAASFGFEELGQLAETIELALKKQRDPWPLFRNYQVELQRLLKQFPTAQDALRDATELGNRP